jgi:hypothetical protein
VSSEAYAADEGDSTAVGSSKSRLNRQSKRRKRSQARKVEEHGAALEIPKISLELCIHRSDSLTLDQLEQLVEQLGYVPYNLVEVGAMSTEPTPEPQVAVLYPMNKSLSSGRYAKDWLPFPTMLWLSCPKLHTSICELEVGGWVEKLQARLQRSDESGQNLAAMRRAHESYAEERWHLLREDDKRRVEENGWYVTNVSGTYQCQC